MSLRERSIANYKYRTCINARCRSQALAYMNLDTNGNPADPISQEVYDRYFTGANKGKYRRWFNGPRSHRTTHRVMYKDKSKRSRWGNGVFNRGGALPQHCIKADAVGASVYPRTF